MKTATKILIGLTTAFVCFVVSGLFVWTSGLWDAQTGEFDTWQATQITRELEALPGVSVDSNTTFTQRGEVNEFNIQRLVIDDKTYPLNRTIPELKQGDKVSVRYWYDDAGTRMIEEIMVVDGNGTDCRHRYFEGRKEIMCRAEMVNW